MISTKGRISLHAGARITLIAFGGILMVSLFPSPSSAIPAFARKYDLSCTVCHTKPPRLNPFGEAFNMAGFQIPATQEGEIRKKRRIGRVHLETDILNIFALRTTGNFVEFFQGGAQNEANLTFPHELELFFAGTLTQNISYFFELESEAPKVRGTEEGLFESQKERPALGGEIAMSRSFLIFNLGFLMKDSYSGPIVTGPMIRVGRIDPSTVFSYPFERQFFKGIPGRVGDDSGEIRRFSLAQSGYAFASKFFGMKTARGNSLEVTEAVLYNGEDFGIDLHAKAGSFILQTGLLQGTKVGLTDVNAKKDPYFMARLNIGGASFVSGSLSGLVSWGNDTAMVNTDLIDWFRYGFAWNIRYHFLDIRGAWIWDKIEDLPRDALATFDDRAFGVSVEADYLIADPLMLMVRYDKLNAGGFINQKADGQFLSLQARYYLRDNLGIYLRDTYNLTGVSSNPLLNFRNLLVFGVDFDW